MKSRVLYITALVVCALGMTACSGETDKDLSVQKEGTGAELQEAVQKAETEDGQKQSGREPEREGGQEQSGREPEREGGQEQKAQKAETEGGQGQSGQRTEAEDGREQNGREPETEGGQEQKAEGPETEAGQEQDSRKSVTEQESGPSEETDGKYGIRFDEAAETYEAEDGTVLLTVEIRFPVLTIPEHEQAAEKINRYVRRNDLFGGEGMAGMSAEETLQWAEEDYQVRGKDNWYTNYSLYKGYWVQRMDDYAVSFVMEVYAYTGGAHPNTMLYGLTFDTQTGERLSFADIVENEEAASAAVLQFLLEETEKEKYQGAFFGNYKESLAGLLREGTWYLGEDGFHIIANTYEIAPYVAGSFDFVIPYEQADFLKEKFLRTDS